MRLFMPDGSLVRHDQCWMARCLHECKEYHGEEIVIERPDSRRVLVQAHATPYFDERGELVGAVNILVDITDRKLAEEASLRLAAIVESSDDAIISKDMNGTITSWNGGAERLYGYTAEEIVGKPISALIPSDHPDDFPAIMGRLRRGERIEHYETVRVCKDGRRVDVSLTISPVRNAEGKIIGASKIARDITERKQA